MLKRSVVYLFDPEIHKAALCQRYTMSTVYTLYKCATVTISYKGAIDIGPGSETFSFSLLLQKPVLHALNVRDKTSRRCVHPSYISANVRACERSSTARDDELKFGFDAM